MHARLSRSIGMHEGAMEAVGNAIRQPCPGHLLETFCIQHEQEGVAIRACHN